MNIFNQWSLLSPNSEGGDGTPEVDMPKFDIFQDHPLHRTAKLQKLKGRKPRDCRLGVYKARVVTCPECGITFDSNIKIKKDE